VGGACEQSANQEPACQLHHVRVSLRPIYPGNPNVLNAVWV
jgi:hypothetical protein